MEFLKPWLAPKDAQIERKTIYTFQSAIARKWRKGRVFIAGDAAHLCHHLWDKECVQELEIIKLAWKIVYVLEVNTVKIF